MKKKIIVSSISAVIVISLLGIIMLVKNNSKINIKISDVKITEDEYIRAANNKKYEVTQYFTQKYGAKVTSDFWQEEFEGESPYEMLADRTMDELLRIHSIYEIAKDKGYVDSAEYEDFITRFNSENEKREEDIKNGKTVYGLSKYTEDLFLEYETDQIQKAYCNDLNNEGMEILLEDGQRYYDDNKDALFTKNDDFELSFVKVYYEALNLPEEKVKDIKNRMIEVSKKIDSSNSLLSLAENDELLKEYFNHENILSAELSSKAKVMGDVLDISMELKKGDITQVLDQNGTLYLIQCIDRVDYDYIPFEEVKDNVNKVLREERYDDIVANSAKNLETSMDMNKVYKFTKNNLK